MHRRPFDRPFTGASHGALVVGLAVLFVGSVVVQIDGFVLAPLGSGMGRSALHTLESMLDGAGILVVAGALALTARNLSAKRRSLPRAKVRLLFLTALSYAAVTGFLLQGLRLSLDPGASVPLLTEWVARELVGFGPPGARAFAYQVTWGLHLALVFAALAALPFCAPHALAAPIQIARVPGGPRGELEVPFDLRAVIANGQFDLQVGAKAANDFGTGARLSLLACTECRRCDEECPAVASGAPLQPANFVQKLRTSIESERSRSTPLLGGALLEDEVWSCLQCGACAEVCPSRVNPPALVMEVRREIASAGRLTGRRAEALENLSRAGNPFGLPRVTRVDVPAELSAVLDGNDTVLWLGCLCTYDARARKVATTTADLLRRAGVSFGVLGTDEACCGDPARRLGEEGRFQELALSNIDMLTRSGVRKIITPCAHCFHVLSKEYRALGGTFEVTHHATALRELVRRGALRPELEPRRSVAIHDACYVGRFDGAFEPPRKLIAATHLAGPLELGRSRERAACCGAGGAGYWFDVPRTVRPGTLRIEEAKRAGAQTVAVECPYCLKMLGEAATAGPEVLDVAEILAESLNK